MNDTSIGGARGPVRDGSDRYHDRSIRSGRTPICKTGLVSGKGLIWAVRDPICKTENIKEKGRIVGTEEVLADAGVEDKRLLVVENEFASTLRVCKREQNTLSPTLRSAWDSGHLRTMAKNSPATATDAHISIITHVTAEELRGMLAAVDGFVVRLLVETPIENTTDSTIEPDLDQDNSSDPWEEAVDPPPACQQCGSLESWQDLLGRQWCGVCEVDALGRALQLAERAARLRKQAQSRKPAPTSTPVAFPPVRSILWRSTAGGSYRGNYETLAVCEVGQNMVARGGDGLQKWWESSDG
jgi:hypothetical protein